MEAGCNLLGRIALPERCATVCFGGLNRLSSVPEKRTMRREA
jgi:sugar lactone lactonase YvrE